MPGLEGDFKLLKAWIKRFDTLSDDSTVELAKRLEAETLRLTRQNFDKKQNPAGIPWRRRKKPQPWPLMRKTGKLRGSFRGSHNARKAEVKSMDPKAKFHQHGTRKMPRRQMLPGRILPSRYSRAYTKEARRLYMSILLGRKIK